MLYKDLDQAEEKRVILGSLHIRNLPKSTNNLKIPILGNMVKFISKTIFTERLLKIKLLKKLIKIIL